MQQAVWVCCCQLTYPRGVFESQTATMSNTNPPFTPYTTPMSNYSTPGAYTAAGATALPPATPTPASRGRPPAKRGRKPRGAAAGVGTNSPRVTTQDSFSTSTPSSFPTSQFSVHWALPSGAGSGEANSGSSTGSGAGAGVGTGGQSVGVGISGAALGQGPQSNQEGGAGSSSATTTPVLGSTSFNPVAGGSGAPMLDTTGLISFSNVAATATATAAAGGGGAGGAGTGGMSVLPAGSLGGRGLGGEEDGEGEDELLPAMADDDYSAQLSWQSQSKDNLKSVFDFFWRGDVCSWMDI